MLAVLGFENRGNAYIYKVFTLLVMNNTNHSNTGTLDDDANVQFVNNLDANYLYNYAKLKIINLLGVKMDVENDSTLFVNTLHLLNFVRDRNTRTRLTKQLMDECTLGGKLRTEMSVAAQPCILLVGIIDDLWNKAGIKNIVMSLEDEDSEEVSINE